MVKMLIDTSVWLGLARDPKDVALVGIIERLIAESLLTLVVPGVVLKEFLAHRERVAIEHGKRLSAHFRTVKEALGVSGGDAAEIERTFRLLDEVDQKSPARTRLASQTFQRIEKLLRGVTPIEPSDTVKLAVYQRAMEERAPFHRQENEAADAVIIEIYSEGVRGGAANDQIRWMFVTRNTRHFSSDKADEKEPHSDYSCFLPGRSQYFISLPEALRQVKPDLVTVLLQTWELEQPTVGELINRYIEETSSTKPLGKSEFYTLGLLRDRAIGNKIAAKLQPRDIVEYCRSRLKDEGINPATNRQHLISLRNVVKTAENKWEVLGVSTDVVDQAMREVEELELVGHGYGLRGRRPTVDEMQKLMAFFQSRRRGRTPIIKMVDTMEFAIASGRHLKEIYSLRWADFDQSDRTCVLKGKRFPLTDEAVAIILRQPRNGELIFGAGTSQSASASFTRAKKELKIDGLRFLDLRREAVMRMLAAKVPLDRIEQLTGLGPLSLARYREQFVSGDAPSPPPPAWKRHRKLRFSARS